MGEFSLVSGRPVTFTLVQSLEDDGTRFTSLSTVDTSARMDVLREMLMHPDTVTGLSDAGAHVTLICDATMPTTQLTHWTETGPRVNRFHSSCSCTSRPLARRAVWL